MTPQELRSLIAKAWPQLVSTDPPLVKVLGDELRETHHATNDEVLQVWRRTVNRSKFPPNLGDLVARLGEIRDEAREEKRKLRDANREPTVTICKSCSGSGVVAKTAVDWEHAKTMSGPEYYKYIGECVTERPCPHCSMGSE